MSELVDYERAATRYDRGRSLPPDSMARWRAAVAEQLPVGPLARVVDVGAGTGLFLSMWRGLGAEEVVAVEPSAAMRARATATAQRLTGVHVVAGTAAQLPVAPGSVDVAWLSTVVHHFPDIDAAAAELARAVRPGGRVLIRGYIPDVSRVAWLDGFMPGSDGVRRRFSTTDRLGDVLGRAGFTVQGIVNVTDPEGPLASDSVTWIETMRDADSLLTALSDDDVAQGIAALRRLGDQRLEPMALSLLTAQR
jgi:SAM-dependent methyltransferase